MAGDGTRSGSQADRIAVKQTNLVGIDGSAKFLVVKIDKCGQIQDDTFEFENTSAGHQKLYKFITKRGAKAKVCMEATGVYHLNLSLYLSKCNNVEVMVVNPRAIKHFALASMQRAKTDILDAAVILQFLQCMPFVQWAPPSDKYIEIQAISRRLSQLKAEMVREKNRRHSGDYNAGMVNLINNDIAVNIRHLERRIKQLEQTAVEIVKSDTKLAQQFDLLTTIKGFATTSAVQVMAELVCLPDDMRAEQWVAYAGLDPRPCQSGTSLDKGRRISKVGNKYLRTALYMPALVAIRYEPTVKGFYEKLIAAGKKPLQAIVAVMRKLLHAIWGMLQTDTEWDGSKFYRAA